MDAGGHVFWGRVFRTTVTDPLYTHPNHNSGDGTDDVGIPAVFVWSLDGDEIRQNVQRYGRQFRIRIFASPRASDGTL